MTLYNFHYLPNFCMSSASANQQFYNLSNSLIKTGIISLILACSFRKTILFANYCINKLCLWHFQNDYLATQLCIKHSLHIYCLWQNSWFNKYCEEFEVGQLIIWLESSRDAFRNQTHTITTSKTIYLNYKWNYANSVYSGDSFQPKPTNYYQEINFK